jgi:peptide/nickel transport system substrate-binding protein
MRDHLVRAAAIVFCAVLSACSGSSTGTSTSSSSAPPVASSSGSGTPHFGGQLRVGAPAAADTVLSIFAHTEGSGNDLSFMYDGLVNEDPDFNLVPWLASSWNISKDGLTYTLHLRKNLRWSDGAPLTADDQLFEYQLTTNPATSAPYKSDYNVVQNVTAPDKYTVVYRLKSPNSTFLSSVIGSLPHAPLPRHIYGKIPPGQLRTYDASKNLVVSGPYKLAEWKHDDHLLLVSNHQWWRRRPYIDQIYIKEYTGNPAILIALQHGDVDTTYFLTTPMWLALKDDARYYPIHNPADVFNQFVVNFKNPILADVNVRRAIMYAWDRKTEAEKLFHGEDQPAVSPIPWAQKWAFDPSTEQAYPFDPKKAADMLDADGWKMGPDGYRQKNGQVLHFTTGEIAGSDITTKSFELFQANMKDAGIKTDASTYEFNVFYQKEQDGQFDLDSGGFGGGSDPDPMIFLSSTSMPPNGLNYGRYSDPVMDKLINEGRVETDRAKRAQIYKALQKRFVDQLPALVDNMPYYRNVLSKRVAGFHTSQAGSQFISTMYTEPDWWIAQ